MTWPNLSCPGRWGPAWLGGCAKPRAVPMHMPCGVRGWLLGLLGWGLAWALHARSSAHGEDGIAAWPMPASAPAVPGSPAPDSLRASSICTDTASLAMSRPSCPPDASQRGQCLNMARSTSSTGAAAATPWGSSSSLAGPTGCPWAAGPTARAPRAAVELLPRVCPGHREPAAPCRADCPSAEAPVAMGTAHAGGTEVVRM